MQRCVIHQIRSSLRYVSWKDHKAFVADLKRVYQATTRDEAETNLAQLDQRWGMKYPMAVRSWQTNWPEVSTFFDYPAEIRRIRECLKLCVNTFVQWRRHHSTNRPSNRMAN